MGCIKVLMDRHFDAVRGFAENILGKKHHAVDDVTQLVWEKIIDGKAEYEKDKSFRVWLVGVTRNLCFMQLRADKRRDRHESAAAEEAMKDAPPQHSVPELADSPFVSDAVKKALASLPPEQSKALWM
jgi:RNA polymerase sigma factor (sigma-70 family)